MDTHPAIEKMLSACPFLRDRIDPEHLDLPTVAMGRVARLVMSGSLSSGQQDQVFGYWNALAETADEKALSILATGAIELFNDGAEAQRLGRANFSGKALSILEDMRVGWGQPDYGKIQ